MGQQIEALAKFVARTQLDEIPPEVQQHAKRVVLDTLGVILRGVRAAGSSGQFQRTARRPTAGTGATVFASRMASVHDPRTAAFLNTVAGRAIELGEGHRYVSYQGAMQILPGVLAVGEWAKASGREMLAALILGYDIGARLAAAMTTRPLAHQNGQAALLGAAAAGARMRGLNAADTSRAMRIATTLVLTPSYNNAINGATTLNVAGGMSGFAAGLVPDLALAGFTAQDDAIEEALANLVGDGFKPEGLLAELGTRWEITRDWFRLRACCNPIYAALDALEAALAELQAAARRHRTHRRGDVRVRRGHAQSGPAELFCLEIFAAARRGRVDSQRSHGIQFPERRRVAESRDRRVAPARARRRRCGADCRRAAPEARARHAGA